VDTLQIGLSITDVSGRIVYTNPAEARMHGFTVEEMLRSEGRALSPREDWQPPTVERLREFRRWTRERTRQRKDGTVFPVRLLSDVVMDEAGRPLAIVTLCEDITERKAAEEALRLSEERYALAVRGTNDGIWDWDLLSDRVYYSPRWKAILGLEDAEVGEAPAEWLGRLHPEDVARVRAKLADHRDGRAPLFEDEHRIRHKDGVYRWVLSRGFAVRDPLGPRLPDGGGPDRRDRPPGLRFADRLPNRALFLERVGYAAARARRRSENRFALLFIDLDGFKAVNDTLGHAAGDQILVAVARRLEACVGPATWWPAWAGTSTPCSWRGSTRPRGPSRWRAASSRSWRRPSPSTAATWPSRPASGSRSASPAARPWRTWCATRTRPCTGPRPRASTATRYSTRSCASGCRRAATWRRLSAGRSSAASSASCSSPSCAWLPGAWPGSRRCCAGSTANGWPRPDEFLAMVEETGLILPLGSLVLREACRQARRWLELTGPD
jgi:PAS domain S-box-containing protein